MEIIKSIRNRIYEIRGLRVMLDRDLAALYDVETKALNLAVKRNIRRFPEDFMFRLSQPEWDMVRSHPASVSSDSSLRFQFETSNSRGGTRYLPYVFTEQGIAMLSGILNSEKAIQMNIAIMRAFVEIRRMCLEQNDVRAQFIMIKQRLGEHDVQLSQIYDSIENLLDEHAAQRQWAERERIGFRQT